MKKRFFNLEWNTIWKEGKNDRGVTLISVLIMVIVMAIIASIALFGGRQIVNNSKETSSQETIAAIKAKVNQLSLQKSVAGVFTPANQGHYGEKATEYFHVENYPLGDWYILEKEDLEELGVKYADNTYAVNYKTNEVYTLSDFDEYMKEKGKELVDVTTSSKYTVNFHPDNEALVSGTMAPQKFVHGVAQYLNPNQYVKEGYHFMAWNTNSNGTGTTYLDRASVLNLTEEDGGSVDLYTIWEVNTYRVVFNANGGTGTTAEQSFTYDIEQYLNANSFTRTGYTFGGWNTRANGTGISYANAASVKNLSAKDGGIVTLYAQWNANTYTVNFNAGADVITAPSPKTVTYGSAYGDLPIPERTGYAFDGWYTEQSGGSKVTSLSIVSIASEHILYAHWTANTCTITLNAGSGVTVNPDHLDRFVGETYGDLPTPNRTGYVFDGWYTMAEGGTKVVGTDTVATAGDQTLYAHWTPNRHMISIANIEGVTITMQGNGDYGETITINATVADGYEFNGWRVKDRVGDDIAVANSSNIHTTFIMPDSNVTITAIINKASYTITYNLNGGSVTSTNPTTYDVTTANFTLKNPTKEGYTFAGWTGSNGTTPQTTVTIPSGSTGDKTYTANWTPIMYAITYLLDGGTNNGSNPANYTIDSSAITLLAPTKPGYTFIGWTGSNGSAAQTDVTITKGSTGDKSYTAKWIPITYTIQYVLDGGTVNGTNPTSYTIESNAINLIAPTKEGYTFAGWTGSNGSVAQTSVTIAKGSTGNKKYTANWTPISYTIQYTLNGGTVNGTNPTSYTIESDAIDLIVPKKEGYTFTGWTGSNGNVAQTSVTIAKGSTGNKEYTANWTLNTCTASFDGNEGTDGESKELNPGTQLGALPTSTRTGYEFVGWFTDRTAGTQISSTTPMPSHDVTYYAHWNLVTYAIGYTLNGGTVAGTNPTSYTIESQSITLTNPTKTGYTFAGWTGSNGNEAQTSVTIATGSTGNREYIATWTPIEYTISYNLNNGEVAGNNPTSYTIESNAITLINPTRAGYTFAGWTGTGLDAATTTVTIATGSTGDREYTATWTPTGYTISYHLDGGTVTGTNPTSYTIESNAITLINPTKTGYEFAGWTGTELEIATSSVIIAKGSTGNREYTATWTPIEYTIGYVLNDGEVAGNNPTSYTIESNAITLINPTKAGYTFAGWTGTGLDSATTTVTIATGSTGNKLYTATWTPIEYTISYTLNDGVIAGTNPTSYTMESNAITLINPTKTGYTFTGWTGTGLNEATTTVTIVAGSTGNREYTATWTPAAYTISYDLDGGTVTGTNPTSYTIESNAIILINPTKSGYIFDGWTGTGLSEVTKTVTIPTGSTGDRNYTANWTEGVAQIVGGTLDGTVYTSVINAINAAPNNVKTKIILLKDTRENFTVGSTKNIVFDFGEYALRVDTNSALIDNNTMIRNDGILEIISGTLEYDNRNVKANILANYKELSISGDAQLISNSEGGLIDSKASSATITVMGGSLTNTRSNGGQAIYSEKGNIIIGGTARLSASPKTSDKARGCVHILGGTAKIIGGTIISDKYGVSATGGTLEIGVKDNYASRTSPCIQGGTNGVYSTINFSFYDGILKGGTAGISNDAKATNKETGYTLLHGTETISGTTYHTAFLGKQYTITFNAGEGTVSPSTMTVINEDTYANLPTPTRTAYIFAGWYTEENGGNRIKNGDIVNLSANTTFYAHWVQNGSTVTYNGTENGGTNPASNTEIVEHGGAVPLNKVATKAGYTFVGWNTDKDATVALESLTMPNSDITLYAIYKKEITVTVNTHGQNAPYTETKTIYNKTTNTSFTLPSIESVTVSGTTYTGRGYAEGDVTDGNSTVALASGGNVTLNANRTYSAMYETTITGTFYYSTTASNTYVKTNGNQATATATATRFMGYTGTKTETNYTVPAAVTGSAGGTVAQTYLGVAIAVDSAEVVTPTTANTTFYAVYTEDVTYYYYNGTAQTSSTVTRRMLTDGTAYNASLASAEPVPAEYEGANFYKWSNSQTSFTSDVLIDTALDTGADELFAVYQKTIAVIYDANDGTNAPANSTGTKTYISKKDGTVYTNNPSITISNDEPTNIGSTFEGWNSSADGTGTDYTKGTAYTFEADTTIYAKWSSIVYTITLDNQSATMGGTASIYEKYSVGYYLESDVREADRMTASTNGIIVPTKTGYTFGGYYTETNGNGTQYIDANGKITNDADATNFNANGVLYAKWIANEYTITLNNQSATTAGTAQIFETYGTKFSLTSGGDAMTTSANGISVPARTNYAFEGYYTETKGGGTQIISATGFIMEGASTTQFSENTTLYAKWRDAKNPSLSVSQETTHDGFEDWELSGGAFIDNNGALVLPNSSSVAKSRHYQAESAWSVTYETYVTTAYTGTKGGTYFISEYYDSGLNSINNLEGASSKGWDKDATLNEWFNVSISPNNKNYGSTIKYITLQFQENTSYSKNPQRIKSFKVHGQLWAGFYDIKINASDNESGIKIIKYDAGERNVDYFATNGIVTTGNTVRVTENGKYTVYVEDNEGNKTIKTITVSKIDKTAPTNTAPTYTKTANSITVTNGQVDSESGIYKVEYAIKENGGEYGAWQSSNEFTGLRSSTTYTVKTRTTNKAYLKTESQETTVTTDTIEYTITLDNQGADTAGTGTIYEKFENNYSLTSGGAAMTSSANPITKPEKTGSTFTGYYTEQNGAGTQIIDANGYLTAAATNTLFTSNSTIYANWSVDMWLVTFDARGGTSSEPTRMVAYGSALETLPTATYVNHIFKGWFTDATGGTQITTSQTITGNVTYYAQWDDAIAEVNGTYYLSLTDAVATVTTSTPTTIRLVNNTSESITINASRNIIFDFGTSTLSNNGANVIIENYGNLTFIGGNITTNAAAEAVINRSGATLQITGGRIEATGTRQAVYNDGGTVNISGGYLSATAEVENNNKRATVYNQSGTMTITGGTIESSTGYAVTNKSTLTIGTKEGQLNTTSPEITGKINGINNETAFNIYDGNIRGETQALATYASNKIGDVETKYKISYERVGIYDHVIFIATHTVTFNPNGGKIDAIDSKKDVEEGQPLGTLPIPTRAGYAFLGWYTDATNGTQISGDTLMGNDEITYYAHWLESKPAEINGTKYDTIQKAIDTCASGASIVIDVIADATEQLEIKAGRNVTINLDGHTISNNGTNGIIKNYGTLTISAGKIDSMKAGYSAIDNNAGGTLILDGVKILAVADDTGTGNRQTVYNTNGTVYIKGNTYLESKASGTTGNPAVPRSTVHNINGGKVYIESGTIVNDLATNTANDNAAISNGANSTVYIGIQDGVYHQNSPTIIGKKYGIYNKGTVMYYDGSIYGIKGVISGTAISNANIENYHDQENTTEVYTLEGEDVGETYYKRYLLPPVSIVPSSLEAEFEITVTIRYNSTIVSGRKAGFGTTPEEAAANASESTPTSLTINHNGYIYAEAIDSNGQTKRECIQITNIIE